MFVKDRRLSIFNKRLVRWKTPSNHALEDLSPASFYLYLNHCTFKVAFARMQKRTVARLFIDLKRLGQDNYLLDVLEYYLTPLVVNKSKVEVEFFQDIELENLYKEKVNVKITDIDRLNRLNALVVMNKDKTDFGSPLNNYLFKKIQTIIEHLVNQDTMDILSPVMVDPDVAKDSKSLEHFKGIVTRFALQSLDPRHLKRQYALETIDSPNEPQGKVEGEEDEQSYKEDPKQVKADEITDDIDEAKDLEDKHEELDKEDNDSDSSDSNDGNDSSEPSTDNDTSEDSSEEEEPEEEEENSEEEEEESGDEDKEEEDSEDTKEEDSKDQEEEKKEEGTTESLKDKVGNAVHEVKKAIKDYKVAFDQTVNIPQSFFKLKDSQNEKIFVWTEIKRFKGGGIEKWLLKILDGFIDKPVPVTEFIEVDKVNSEYEVPIHFENATQWKEIKTKTERCLAILADLERLDKLNVKINGHSTEEDKEEDKDKKQEKEDLKGAKDAVNDKLKDYPYSAEKYELTKLFFNSILDLYKKLETHSEVDSNGNEVGSSLKSKLKDKTEQFKAKWNQSVDVVDKKLRGDIKHG